MAIAARGQLDLCGDDETGIHARGSTRYWGVQVCVSTPAGGERVSSSAWWSEQCSSDVAFLAVDDSGDLDRLEWAARPCGDGPARAVSY